MDQLYFEGKVINLYSEDYEFLQESINKQVSAAVKYFIANQNGSCIVQGFNLKINENDPTTFDVGHGSGGGAVLSSNFLLYSTDEEYTQQHLSAYTTGSVMGIYIKLDYALASYDRKKKEVVFERKAVDHYDQTLVYNRKIMTASLEQITDADFDEMSDENKANYILLGKITANGIDEPLSPPDFTGVDYMTINIGYNTITPEHLHPGFMLDQEQVDTTKNINDSYDKTQPTTTLEDDLNLIRTLIRDIKKTDNWDDHLEGVIASVPEMNDLFEIGVFTARENFDIDSIEDELITIKPGSALVGDAIKLLLETDPRTLTLPGAHYKQVGNLEGTPENPGVPTDGEEHDAMAHGTAYFYLKNAIESYVHFRSEDVVLMHKIHKNERKYIEGEDYNLDPETGKITLIYDEYDNNVMIGHDIEAYYTCSMSRIDVICINDKGLGYIEGIGAPRPTSPKIPFNTLPLYYIHRTPFKDEVEMEDIVDVRIERKPLRDTTSIGYNDNGMYEGINFYPTRFWTFYKYSILENDTNSLMTKGNGWDIADDYLKLEPDYTYQTIVHFQKDDELWINVKLQQEPFDITISIENQFNSNDFTPITSTIPGRHLQNDLPSTPILLIKGLGKGTKRIKIESDVVFQFEKLLIGKYEHSLFNNHLYSKNITAENLSSDFVVSKNITAENLSSDFVVSRNRKVGCLYNRDDFFKAKSATARTTIVTPAYVEARIDDSDFYLTVKEEIDLDTTDKWDDAQYNTPANRAGLDFYIYACIPDEGNIFDIVLSRNATTPSGYSVDESRKIGGFHCLCVSAGTAVYGYVNEGKDADYLENMFADGSTIANGDTNHWLKNFIQGDILPLSCWDLIHRPNEHSDVEGKVFDPKTNLWVDIYLPSWNSGLNKLLSVYGGTIADGASSPAFHWYRFSQAFTNQGQRLPRQDHFVACSLGSPQGVNIAGGADPVTTGGKTATNSLRIISNIGVEDATGVLWQWGSESGTNTTTAPSNAYDANDKNVGGQEYSNITRPFFGGACFDGVSCGSRGSAWAFVGLYLGSAFSGRGFAEPK